MIPPIYVRKLTEEEQRQLEAGLRSKEAFTMRRSQIVLASAKGQRPSEIAENLSCAVQSVRNAINKFNSKAMECLIKGSSRPHKTRLIMDEEKCEQIKDLLHHSPYEYGKKRSTWTLKLVAEVCFEKGITEQLVTSESISNALKRLKVGWKRAKHWITSPDPQYELKKSKETDL